MTQELSYRPEIYYYRHNGTTVTSRYISTPSSRYHLRDLTRFELSQRPAGDSGLKVGLVAAALELVVVVPVLTFIEPSTGLALVLPAMLVPLLAGYFYGKRRPGVLELVALYRGQPVTLYASADQDQFGRVTRAVRRAVEAAQG